MRFFSIFIVFIFTASYGQSYKADMFYGHFRDNEKYFGKNTTNYFEVTGKVKKIKSKEISYVTFKKRDKYNPYLQDSITNGNFRSGTILEFNPNQKLTAEYWLCQNDSVQLREKHQYNDENLETENQTYYDNGKFIYSEKFIYDGNLLREQWAKSSFQSDYFLKERYSYDNKNQIFKKEELNNNLQVYPYFTCKGGYLDEDHIYYHFYDAKGNLTRTECNVFQYKAKFKGPPEESLFALNSVAEYSYSDGKISNESIRNVNDNEQTVTTYTYNDAGKLILEERLIPGRRQLKVFTKYYYKGENLYLIEYGYGTKVDSKYYYENGILRKFETINNNGVAEYRIYNEKGVLTEQSRDGKLYEYQYEYDSKGNWINYKQYKNKVLIEKKIREIEYYD